MLTKTMFLRMIRDLTRTAVPIMAMENSLYRQLLHMAVELLPTR